MANVKISQLTPKGANLAATDLLEISEFNGSGYETKSITGQEIIDAASGGGVAWGDITGTLSSQTDLDSALSGKQATLVSGTNIKTINGSSVLGSGNITTASVNATSGVLPYNNGGVFADSGYKYSESGGSVTASIGMAVCDGEAIINCAMSSPSNGVFRASSTGGAIWVGPYGASYGVGFNTNNDSMLIGSSLMSTASYTTIAKWAQVSDENGNIFYIPLYQ